MLNAKSVFLAGFGVNFSYRGRAVKTGFGRSSTYVDENRFPDYTLGGWQSSYSLLL